MVLSRGEIDHDAIMRFGETAVDQCEFDAMGTFSNRLFGQPDENCFRKRSGRQIDFDIDWECFDS